MLQEDKNAIFKLSEYSPFQKGILHNLNSRYWNVKWLQYLTPYHCSMLYNCIYLGIPEDGLTSSMDYAFNVYGNITVKLDYAINLYIKGNDILPDQAYAKLRNSLHREGDDLADMIMILLKAGYPKEIILLSQQEQEVEEFILRKEMPEEGIEWVKEYLGSDLNNVNIVSIWNRYSSLYYKQAEYVSDDEPVD